MILLPLVLMGVAKWGPLLLKKPKVSSVSILPSHVYAPKQYDYMVDDVPNRLRQTLSTIQDMKIQRTPLPREVGQADRDLIQLSNMVGGADVLVQPTMTLDEGILELTLEAIYPATMKVLFDESFDSTIEQYPQMVQAAGTALKKAIQP